MLIFHLVRFSKTKKLLHNFSESNIPFISNAKRNDSARPPWDHGTDKARQYLFCVCQICTDRARCFVMRRRREKKMNESYLWSRHCPTACLYLSKINGMDVGVFSKRNRPKKYSGLSVIRDVIHDRRLET